MAKPSTPKRPRAAKAARKSDKPARSGKAAPRAAQLNRKQTSARPATKLAQLQELLRRKEGATIADLTAATGWQAHSVRGAISGTLKKKLGLTIASEKTAGRDRVYRIVKRG